MFGPSKLPIFKRFRLRFSYFQKPDDDGLKMARPVMTDLGMLRSQSSSASLRVAESAAFQSRPNRPFWAPFSAQGSIPPATRGCTVHMVPRACAKAAVPGETAGSWPETGEVSMISSSPPAHASTRETHLRRCSSHPPLRLRSCPPRQRKQVASEGLRGARVCPQLTSNSRAGDTQDGARSSKNLDGCTRASPRPSQFATAAQKRALPWSTTAQPDQ